MSENIVMPKLGMTMTEGTIEEWHNEVGETVKAGDPVLTISSEKLTQDVEAPSSGVLLSQVIKAGDEAQVGEVIGVIGEEGEDPSGTTEEPIEDQGDNIENTAEPDSNLKEKTVSYESESKQITKDSSAEQIFITPLARKMAGDKNLEIELIKGSGGNNRITKLDIQRVENQGYDYAKEKQAAGSAQAYGTPVESIGEGLPSMRKAIAKNMRESLANSAQLTLHRKASADKIIAMQKKLRNDIEETDLDIRLTITVLIARATVLALQDYKKMNSTYHDGELIEYDEVHLGIASSLEEGLVVPVVKNAHQKTIGNLAKDIKSVSTHAREGTASGDLLSGSTFTITNMGATGIEYFTPILNAPESGILGVGALQEELTLNDDQEVVLEKKIPFSLTFDHQILDGADAAEFLSVLIKYIESPNLLVL